MRNSVRMLVVPALVLAAACGRNDNKSMDDGLKNDLSLASQMQAYPQQFVSPTELGYNGYGYSQPYSYAQPYGYSAYGMNTAMAQQQCTAAVQSRLYNRTSLGSIPP